MSYCSQQLLFIYSHISFFCRWLCIKQFGHHDRCCAHAHRCVGHFVFSAGPVAFHQTTLQEIHFRTASPWWVSHCLTSLWLLPVCPVCTSSNSCETVVAAINWHCDITLLKIYHNNTYIQETFSEFSINNAYLKYIISFSNMTKMWLFLLAIHVCFLCRGSICGP